LAYHFFQGNDLEKAFAYSTKAGENAERSFSWARAASHFATALSIVEKRPVKPVLEARLREKLADLEALQGRTNLEHSHKALSLFIALDNRERACRMHRLIGVAWTSGTAGEVDLVRALHHFEKAAEIIEPQPDSTEKALAYGYLAFGLLRAKSSFSQAKNEAEKALAIADRIGDAGVRARVHTELGVIAAFMGDLSSAEASAEQSWRIADKAGDLWVRARAALYPIAFWPWRNERGWLERWTERCLEHRQSSRITRYDLAIYSLHALLLALTGRPEQARQSLGQAEAAMAERAYFTPYWLHFTAAACAIVGDQARADALFEDARRASRAGSLSSHIAEVALYAKFLVARGDRSRAAAILRDAYPSAQEHGSVVQELNLLPLLAEVSARNGDLKQAGDYLAQAERLQNRWSAWRGLAAPVSAARGVLALERSDWELAERSFAAALNEEQQHGFLYAQGRILLQWAEVYRRRNAPGDHERARALRGRARAIFADCGAALPEDHP